MKRVKALVKRVLRKRLLSILRPELKRIDGLEKTQNSLPRSPYFADRKDLFLNDIRYNYVIDDKVDMRTKRTIVSQIFYNTIGYYPNLSSPKTFSEKVLWLKLYYHDPRISVCGDKYRAKSYIDSVLGGGYTVPLIQRYECASDIDFDALPDQFVLKVNWRTGCNIVVEDKSRINADEIRAKLDYWCLPWKNSYYGSFNWGYHSVEPIIFAEQYLDIPHNTTEYKMFCFNGRVEFALLELDYFGKNPKRAYYDRSWKELPFQISRIKKASVSSKPDTFDDMVRIAEKLAAPFPYVRVDFYDISGKLYVGEMTFYSGGGFSRIIPGEWDTILGERLDISCAMRRMAEECAGLPA